MIDRRLTAAELDELIRRNRIPRIPQGCDQQGRHPEAAEAATEVGADDDDPLSAARGMVWGIIAALLIWCGIALVGLALWPALRDVALKWFA